MQQREVGRETGGGRCGHVERGFTFVEMLVVVALVAVLASAVMPLAKVTMQRQREGELRRVVAGDAHGDRPLQGRRGPGLDSGDAHPARQRRAIRRISKRWSSASRRRGRAPRERKLKFLRRVPIDPMTREPVWGLRAYEDKPDSKSWGGGNVYDVYSKSDGTALDGTKYADW